MENPRRIKPLLQARFHLRSIYAYKDCLIRRPKNVLSFECAHIEAKFDKSKAQFKLLKASKLLKPVQKVNLLGFTMINSQRHQPVFFSVLKSISKTPTISLIEHHTRRMPMINAPAKGVKLLPNLRNLAYTFCFMDQSGPFPNIQDPNNQIKDPLRYLKDCPKIQHLEVRRIDIHGNFERTLEIFKLQRYPTSLKHLFLEVALDRYEDQNFVIPFQHFRDLESVHLAFNHTLCHNYVIRNIEELSKMPNLQKLILQFQGQIFPAIHPILKEMAQRKTLKKLALICSGHYPGEEALQSLQEFDQLTHFRIKAFVSNSQEWRQITQSIQNMTKLEYLNVEINSHEFINAPYELQILCLQVNNFDSLRHLKLSLSDPRAQTRQSFVPFLHQTLTKPIKLETLSFSCHQLDPAQTVSDLVDALQDSVDSLHTLELDFRTDSSDKQLQKAMVNLIQNLRNLQVLSLRDLVITSRCYFEELTRAIHKFKHLRRFTLGKIEEEAINPSLFEDIVSKRGLNSFICEVSAKFESNIECIAKKNPFLEICQFSHNENDDENDLLEELETWDSPKWLGLPKNESNESELLSERDQSNSFYASSPDELIPQNQEEY